MNSEMLYEAITEISDSYVTEADPELGSGFMPKLRRLRPILSMAAVFALVLGLGALALDRGLLGGLAKSEAPADTGAEYSLARVTSAEQAACDGAVETTEADVELFTAMEEAAEEEAEPVVGDEDTEEVFDQKTELPAGELTEGGVNQGTDTPAEKPMPEPPSDAPVDSLPDEEVTEGTDDLIPEEGIAGAEIPATVSWNGTVCVLNGALVSSIPADCEFGGTMSVNPGSVFFTDSESLHGSYVYISSTDTETAIYVTVGASYAKYLVS